MQRRTKEQSENEEVQTVLSTYPSVIACNVSLSGFLTIRPDKYLKRSGKRKLVELALFCQQLMVLADYICTIKLFSNLDLQSYHFKISKQKLLVMTLTFFFFQF